ncbi:hypothetical protein KFK09_022765 [Dendrobium nobile]|uniref:protein-histidine N-methyltransferase n=1 Tax=Dendrobium nobile TaxID=94219 RepID=A0A8T3AK75_DENNO|nr:hypothetical protein KFK09_022765 [Dendrobium nobile]
MTEENRISNPKKSYPFFAISNTDQLGPSFGFFGAPQKPPPPLPSCVEVSLFELGCGHGLPGIFTALKGASTIHFQDFNAEVLRFLTVPNAKANLIKNSSQCQTSGNKAEVNMLSTVRFFAGDWSEVHHLLLQGSNDGHQNEEDYCTRDVAYDGYDIILMAETIYEPSSLQHLYELIKKCLCHPKGIVYMAGKKHYFGVGGGTRQFIDLAEVDGQMKTLMLAEVADGSSNVREVWKLSNE